MKKQYTQKDLKWMLMIAFGFSFLFMVDYFVIALQEEIEWSALVNILSWTGFLPLFIVVCICWYMCAERYFEIECGKHVHLEKKKRYITIGMSVLILGVFGSNLLGQFLFLIVNLAHKWDNIDELFGVVLLRIGIVIAWLLHFFYCVVKHRSIGGQKGINIIKVIVWLCYIVILTFLSEYVYDMWIQLSSIGSY